MTTVHERTVSAMGTTIRVVVVGGSPSLADHALHRIDDLERKWSRFRGDSEVSRLNDAGGAPCLVSPDTYLLVEHLVDAWWDTDGRFDPTVHDAVVGIGYGRSWPFAEATADGTVQPSPGCRGIRLDALLQMVWLPDGVRLDPGALGKGLAADLVAQELVEGGASGVMVDLGGDLRVIGVAPTGNAWRIGVEHPVLHTDNVAVVECTDGGIATSSRVKRRWRNGPGRDAHHIVDPSTGDSADRMWCSATALARTAVAAEVGATMSFLDGTPGRAPYVHSVLLCDEQGSTTVVGDHPEFFLTTLAA